MFNKVKYLIHPFKTIATIISTENFRVEQLLRQLRFERVSFDLTKNVLHSCERGISSERISDKEIIVSLTSYGRRIHDVYLAIESIMEGTVKPNRIILWLNETEFQNNSLPFYLQKQIERGLEIHFCKDIRSYTKLIYALQNFPNSAIITIDDDAIYNFDFLENLIKTHKANPSCICANRIHRITRKQDTTINSYLKWEWCIAENKIYAENAFFTGVGGVLYPPHSLHEEVFNENVFTKICPTADDVWFNAMARLKGTKICKSFTHSSKGEDFILNEDFQIDGLGSINNAPENNQNDIQIKAVFERYKI